MSAAAERSNFTFDASIVLRMTGTLSCARTILTMWSLVRVSSGWADPTLETAVSHRATSAIANLHACVHLDLQPQMRGIASSGIRSRGAAAL